MKTFSLTLITLIGCLTLSDAQQKKPKAPLDTGGERKLGVVYKTVGQRELALDVYYPLEKKAEPCPVIVYTHGGGWAAGSRFGAANGLFASLFKQLVRDGFCIVSVDYRLYRQGGPVRMRDCVIDSKDAVRYLAKNSDSLRIDPERMFVFGDSAGGQIAQMLLLSPPDKLTGDPELAEVDYRIVAGLSWYGPCDFENIDLFNHDDSPDFRDRFGPRITGENPDPEEKKRLYREMSPVSYLRPDSPPLLMIQGDQDTTIPVKHARYMEKRAKELQAPVETLIVRNAGHNWRKVGTDIAPSREEILRASVAFFHRHVVPGATDVMPPFSWDRVPVYAHVGKVSDDFTPEELDFLAENFDFITIEKHQASHKHGSTEAGFTVAIHEIKKRNPDAKVLYYWNASLDSSSSRGVYQAMETFPADGFLKDSAGNTVMRRKTVPNYDLTKEDVREWWSDAAAKAVHEYGADGIFADAMGQDQAKGVSDERLATLVAARVELLEETRRKIGPGKLIIYNGLLKDDPRKLLQFADGAMIESFGHPKYGDSKEALTEAFEATRAAAGDGKIVLLKGWPGFTFREKETMQKPRAELARLAKENITLPLAWFLVAAEANSFFCYTWGYREKHGTFDWYPEFDKPLGPPHGTAEKDGWTYRREFAHASVSVNLETQAASIEWK